MPGLLHAGSVHLTAGASPGALPALVALVLVGAVAAFFGVWLHVRNLRRRHAQQLRAERSRRSELEAALGSMVEGVLMVDRRERLLSVNPAAERILDFSPRDAIGRSIHEALPTGPLVHLITETLGEDRPGQADLEMPALAEAPVDGHGPEGRTALYQAQSAVLRDPGGERLGALVVLHEVTRLRRLEMIRRDFVANASHEIKTPVAAMKAAAETLGESDGRDTGSDRRFIGVIGRQAERLENIVDGLLSLARIERDTDQHRLELVRDRVRNPARAAAETCRPRAEQNGTRIELDVPDQLSAPLDSRLLEQALVNLLDNAIKYSPAGSTVRVEAGRVGDEVVIAVRDEGVGIDPEHQPRVFERFYRTDKARSRQLGGSGLGLSIVNHVARAHHGRVSLDSTPHGGSTFRIHLPAG